MKNFNTFFTMLIGVCALNYSVSGITIKTSYVSNVNNDDDGNASDAYGGVDYNYYIGTYEVTNTQYTAFLNAKGASNAHDLWNPRMNEYKHQGGIERSGTAGSYTYSVKVGMGNKPVNNVNFWDAARFVNWLTNGKGDGDTETGMYNTLNGVLYPDNRTVTREQSAWTAGGVAIANHDEWYKAAYYDPDKNDGSGGYWLYANRSDSIDVDYANYKGSVNELRDVGSYETVDSFYGTFDQSGNVWEWIEDDQVRDLDNPSHENRRVVRGGGYLDQQITLRASSRYDTSAHGDNNGRGFRVTSLNPIPEPSAYSGILGGLALAIAIVRRKGGRIL